jgi:hypothetical protein
MRVYVCVGLQQETVDKGVVVVVVVVAHDGQAAWDATTKADRRLRRRAGGLQPCLVQPTTTYMDTCLSCHGRREAAHCLFPPGLGHWRG